MTHRNLLFSLLFLALSMLAQLAYAQTTPAAPARASAAAAPAAPQNGNFFSNLEGAVRQFNDRLNLDLAKTMKHYAVYDVASKIKQPALVIGGVLALVYLLWECLQFIVGSRSSMATVLADVGIPCTLAAFLIHNYELRIMQFDEMLDVFRMASLQTSPTGQLMSLYGGVMADIGRAIMYLFGNLVDVSDVFMQPGKWFSSLANFIATILFALVILYLVLLGIAEVMGLLLFGPFLSAIGMGFGPLLIVGLVTPWTMDYFKKWLQFLVVSAALTGVLNVTLAIAGSLLGPSGLGLAELSGGEPNAAGLVIVTVLLLTVNSLIAQAPSIASALLPGSLGASKGASGGVRMAVEKAKGHGQKGAKMSVSASKHLASGTKYLGAKAATLAKAAIRKIS
ncbi:hypothetical protein [Massilia sp. erpn]|uniref:hypothetical protein n=1 Tax=Massilia sp. erpn TaxID=2738142 RepID=UPI002103DA13|nr:hypothetical protein [Massilia sp. erpn]UTY55869.1 hypothetical protein HPQ68_00910 [Massilia sp. erpn]